MNTANVSKTTTQDVLSREAYKTTNGLMKRLAAAVELAANNGEFSVKLDLPPETTEEDCRTVSRALDALGYARAWSFKDEGRYFEVSWR